MAPPKLDVTAHVGDRAVLLAFDVPHDDADGLAGFAVFVTPPKGKPYWLKNRLSFTRTTGSGNEMRYFDSHDAPFQMFHWVHFPPEGPGTYRYEVTSRYFVDRVRATLRDGAKKELEVEIPEQQVADKVKVTIGMTRGYVSSQAFIDRFGGNADLTPDPWSPDADVSAFEPRYHFLGAHARELTLAFLDKVKSDRLDLDVFAYDLNSPEVVQRIAAIAKAGQTVRLFQDDSVARTATPASRTATASTTRRRRRARRSSRRPAWRCSSATSPASRTTKCSSRRRARRRCASSPAR